jgi:hypothetical protein
VAGGSEARKLAIRDERLDDVVEIDRLHREAFGGERGPVVAALVADLRDATKKDGGLSLVAESGGAVVVMFSLGWLDPHLGSWTSRFSVRWLSRSASDDKGSQRR